MQPREYRTIDRLPFKHSCRGDGDPRAIITPWRLPPFPSTEDDDFTSASSGVKCLPSVAGEEALSRPHEDSLILGEFAFQGA